LVDLLGADDDQDRFTVNHRILDERGDAVDVLSDA
jgi:hypothetical protein